MRLLLLTLCIILFGGNTLRLEAKKYFFSNYNFCHITEEAGLPNNDPNWNYKYQVSFVLMNEKKEIVL